MQTKRHLRFVWFGILPAILCTGFPNFSPAQIAPAKDAPRPLPPEESLAMFRVEPGFRVELVAAEPHLADPVAITFDAAGNIFACEIHGYNLDGHFDIVELNKTGKLDKSVRRIPATDWAIKKAEKQTYGSVRMLVDEDGDGQVDRSSVFADHLPPCYGLVPARGGIIVLCAPDIYYLADRDGDGKAEHRERLFTGLNEGELWSRSNNLKWGEDNWIYACAGRGGAVTISGPHLKEPVDLGNSNYRFKADGSAMEPATGSAGGFGLGISDWGDQFLISNSTSGRQVIPIPFHYQLRNPFSPSPGSDRNAATYYDVFPISRPHPWRVARGSQKAWRDFYGEGEAKPNGSFTAACSPTFYRGSAFPPEYHGNLFVCESQQNLVSRTVPVREGTLIQLRRPEGFDEQEFLASSDGWFRPVNLATAPDGALYVVDMSREIIEDYSAIPRYLQQQYGLNKGNQRGRIWRVRYVDAPAAEKMNLAGASSAELIAAIAHPNAIWRQTAQRLLVERGDKSVVSDLKALVLRGPSPQARIHALFTLDGLDALSPAVVDSALSDDHFAVRRHALRLADRRLGQSDTLLATVAAMTLEPDAAVRLQLALTLGESQDPRTTQALADLAARHLADDWMHAAIMSSVASRPERLLAEILSRGKGDDSINSLVGPLCEMIGTRRDEAEVETLLTTVVQSIGDDAPEVQRVCLEGLLSGLEGRDSSSSTSDGLRKALGRLLAGKNPQTALLAYRIAGALGADDLPEVEQMFAAAERRAMDDALTVDDRSAAVGLLTNAPYERLKPIVAELLEPRQPIEIQLAAVRAVSESGDDDAGQLLLAGWKGYSPRVRDEVLTAVLARTNRLPTLLDALERGDVPVQSIDPLRRLRLLEHPDQMLRERAAALLKTVHDDAARAERFAAYRAALDEERDVPRGREVFIKNCANCHRTEEQGHDVGPPLASAINRPDEALLSDVLEPSGRITQGFPSYVVVTADGRVFQGVLASESATSVTLRREKGDEDVILRKDIDQMVASGKSLMPEEIEKEIDPSDMADMLGYLRSIYGPRRPTRVTLFDDDPEFPVALKHGRGSAEVETEHPYSGETALRITAVQRYSNRIKDWHFPIVAEPGPGQYRYLRMAWKSEHGEGVGVELAADGSWGPAESRNRRYYSGKNTAPWQARQISPDVPRDWTVVTIDLWKDNGEFTLTGIAPTAMEGEALFDRIELLGTLDDVEPGQ